MTPPPFDAPAWDANKPLPESGSRSNDVAREYGERVKKVSKEHACSVLDVFDLLGGNGDVDFGQYLSDGLHLNASGNTKLYEGLMELVQQELPHLVPAEDESTIGIPMEEKLWTDLC